ncbi:complement C1q-like protein 4 [Centropristis striata]|uniref:complement C1q-like protein 4 n=1 Tax=Centropristis striata TaxID=184440 RepID=UPI0027DEFD6A|nr:complement C1q-like protein 4 [Centropristis striata]
MKVAESFLLLLLAASSFMVKSTATCQPNIYDALTEMTASLIEQKVEIRLLHVENKEQAAKVQKQQAELHRLKKQQQGRQVAFSVALVPSGRVVLGPFNVPTTLIFKHVQTNIGNGYNKRTGILTAPVKGAYHFEWHVGTIADNKHPSAAALIKNSEIIGMAWEGQKTGYGTGSNSVTLLLEVGDAVFVRLWHNTMMYDSLYHYYWFSGHLLFPM